MPYLGLLDLSGIQNYLFREPQLKSIAWASRVIEAMSAHDNRFAPLWSSRLFAQAAEACQATLVVAAGGNAAFCADQPEMLKAVFRDISCKLLVHGNGLEAVVCIEHYDEKTLAVSYRYALQRLENAKMTQQRSADERFAGLSAAQSPNPLLPDEKYFGLTIPKQPDAMICDSEEQSDLVAVVSIDGIGMGKRLIAWLEEAIKKERTDQEFVAEYRAWSKSVKDRWAYAWDASLREVCRAYDVDKSGILKHPSFPNRKLRLHKSLYFPCRPIYQGGDDFSFICDARIALALTVFFLQSYQNFPLEDSEVPELFHHLTASAGIVFVDAHFPFVRAVGLAEDVRKSAKRRAVDINPTAPPATLDWWLNRQGALLRPPLPFPGASLKPYPLTYVPHDGQILSWQMLEAILGSDTTAISEPSRHGSMWTEFADRRNKLKDLQEAAEEGMGGRAVKRLLHLRPLPSGSALSFLPPGFDSNTGFNLAGARTPLLDACELYDLHFPFPPRPSALP